MPFDFTTTDLWKRTLAEQDGDDPYAEARTLLRDAYLSLRTAVKPLAGEIAQSMPNFTVHSIEHSDGLWRVASTLMPEPFAINPAEAYVLGGTFLFHDLGMGLSAYEGGEASVKADPLFADVHSQLVDGYTLRSGSEPDAAEMKDIAGQALAAVLRRRHAKVAEELPTRSFKTSFNDNHYLMEKTELRHVWGPLIGKIAHSHWFNINALESEFGKVKGSPSGFPSHWDVDPLKIACALRISDACHVDADRAPTYLSAVRPQQGVSAEHWYFQERLNQPRLEGDRFVYSSNTSFDADHAREWWLAFETAAMISSELHGVDALMQDTGRERFAARAVAGVESPERFSQHVEVDGWTPIDAQLRVTSVENLAASMGGKNLYGDTPTVALRELIANAADAVRARIAQYQIASDPAVYVRLEHNRSDEWWLRVEDRGIGMSRTKMVSALTDFGHSGWTSSETLETYPGLLSRGYSSIGRFGVGFFSAFMVAEEVRVASLKYREASRETSVLEFQDGLAGRPLLRQAKESEEIHPGGTVVSLRLKHPPLSSDGILRTETVDGSVSEMFQTLLKSMCALMEFDVLFQGPGDDEYQTVVRGGEWKASAPVDLFRVAYAEELRPSSFNYNGWTALSVVFGDHASDISDDSGDVVGRASLGLTEDSVSPPWWISTYGRVYVGGLEAGRIYGLLGVFVGEPLRADRLRGFPIATPQQLTDWATAQAKSVPTDITLNRRVARDLDTVRGLGSILPEHPIAYTVSGHLTPSTLAEWVRKRRRIDWIPLWELSSFSDGAKIKLLDFDSGSEVIMSEDMLSGSVMADWIFPEEVRKYPRDDRFADHGALRADTFNARYWWHLRGSLGLPAALLEAIESAWSMSPLEIADATVAKEMRYTEDDRLALNAVGGGVVKVDAISIVRADKS